MTESRFSNTDTAWWSKFEHAGRHIDQLARVCHAYQARDPLRVEPESTEQPDKTAYRLRIRASIPLAISLILGDVVHNLRSALDCLVFEIVEVDLGRKLSPDEEQSCQFPIYDEPSSFERFFNRKWRNKIMSSALREILRSVQPFYGLEYLSSVGRADDLGSYADYSPYHGLSTLARVSNIDKHRRLAVTAWWPDIVSWGSDGETHRRWLPGDGTFVDGSIVGYIVGSDGPGDDVVHEFNLILADPFPPVTGSAGEVVGIAKRWQMTVDWTLGQVIARYERLRL